MFGLYKWLGNFLESENNKEWFRDKLSSALIESPDGALFSNDRKHRFLLWRCWSKQGGLTLFVGLNPSMADETSNDPTIRRIIGFAKREGASGVLVANLFSLCATRPEDLKAARIPVRNDNDKWLDAAQSLATRTIACWGVHGNHLDRSRAVRSILGEPFCLGTTKHGEPRHPLYLKSDTALQPMTP